MKLDSSCPLIRPQARGARTWISCARSRAAPSARSNAKLAHPRPDLYLDHVSKACSVPGLICTLITSHELVGTLLTPRTVD
eukprot:2249150-Rhodomonas_salina.3